MTLRISSRDLLTSWARDRQQHQGSASTERDDPAGQSKDVAEKSETVDFLRNHDLLERDHDSRDCEVLARDLSEARRALAKAHEDNAQLQQQHEIVLSRTLELSLGHLMQIHSRLMDKSAPMEKKNEMAMRTISDKMQELRGILSTDITASTANINKIFDDKIAMALDVIQRRKMNHFARLPPEMLLRISNCLPASDLTNLSLSCKLLCSISQEVLFINPHVTTWSQLAALVKALARRPELAQKVQSLNLIIPWQLCLEEKEIGKDNWTAIMYPPRYGYNHEEALNAVNPSRLVGAALASAKCVKKVVAPGLRFFWEDAWA